MLFRLDKIPNKHYIDIMPYTTQEADATLQVYSDNSEEFSAVLRPRNGAARAVASGILSTGGHLLSEQAQVLSDGIQEVYANGSALAILNDSVNIFTVAGEHFLATIDSASGWIIENAGASWGWIEFQGRWIKNGGTALLKLRKDPPEPVIPFGMTKEYQADKWPPGGISQGDLRWVDIMVSDGFFAWASSYWSFLSQSEYLSTQSLVIWNNSGGFQVDVPAWTAAEGREPIVSAENILDAIPIPWRLRTQSGVKYLQAQVRFFYDSEDAGYFLPRNGLGKPASGTTAPLSALLLLLFLGGVLGDKIEGE